MDWTVTINIALVVLSALGVVAAFRQARLARLARDDANAADARAQEASERASAIAEKAAEASVRAATAAERANDLFEAAQPKPQGNLEIQHLSNALYRVINTGDAMVRRALVEGAGEHPGLVSPKESEPRDLAPGDEIGFFAMTRIASGDARVAVSFDDPATGERQRIERVLH